MTWRPHLLSRCLIPIAVLILTPVPRAGAQEFAVSGTSSAIPPPAESVTADLDGDPYLDLVFRIGMPAIGGFALGAFFDVAVNPPAAMSAATVILIPPVNSVFWFVVADTNGDGIQDLIFDTGGFPTSPIWAALGNGNGTFQPATVVIPSFLNPVSIIAADVTGDSRADLVTFGPQGAASLNFGLRIYRSVPGTWPLALFEPDINNNAPVIFGDYDGDGVTDIVYVTQDALGARLYKLVRGSAFLAVPTIVPVPPSVAALTAVTGNSADLDEDGFDDVFLRSGSMAQIGYLRGAAANPLATAWTAGGLSPPAWAAGGGTDLLTDIDGDQHVDFLTRRMVGCAYVLPGCASTTPTSSYYVLRNRGGGQFTAPAGMAFLPSPLTAFSGVPLMPPADMDADGDPDLFERSVPNFSMVYIENRSRFGLACPGAPGNPSLAVGPPFPGNAGFAFQIGNGLANAQAGIFVSLAAFPPAAACGPLVNLSPANLLIPTAAGFGWVTMDALGASTLALPIPNVPSLSGARVYAQAAILDPAGTFPLPGGGALAITAARAITIN